MATTLYEDWHRRRQRLEVAPPLFGQQYLNTHVRVLDYLLERYRNDEAAQRQARFPFAESMVVNSRAILVHHRMGRRHAVESDADAGAKAQQILRRMAERTQTPAESEDAFGSGFGPGGEPVFGEGPPEPPGLFGRMFALMKNQATDWRIDEVYGIRIGAFRRQCLAMERDWMAVLIRNFGESESVDEDFMHFLLSLKPYGSVPSLLLIWQHRLMAFGIDGVTEQLEELLFAHKQREEAADAVRLLLAHSEKLVRMGSLRLLLEFGSLDDLGLLGDLLLLSDEELDLYERAAVLKTMEILAGMKTR